MSEIDDLSQLSGETSIRKTNKVSFPTLKFNGSKNQFSKSNFDPIVKQYVTENLTAPLEIVILKVRRQLTSFERTSDGGSLRYYTNEHDAWNDNLVLFKKAKTDLKPKVEMQDSGIDELKEKFPKLRLNLVLYVLFQEVVHKLSVKGKSLSSLFDYFNSLAGEEHIFEHYLKVQSHEETNEGGLTYYVLDFEQADPVDIKKIATHIRAIDSILKTPPTQITEEPSSIVIEDKTELDES